MHSGNIDNDTNEGRGDGTFWISELCPLHNLEEVE